MRRMLSSAVQVRPPFSQREREIAALVGKTLAVQMPTESEVRDAMARLSRMLDDDLAALRGKTGRDWEVVEFGFPVPGMPPRLLNLEGGEIAIRGTLIVTDGALVN